MTTHEKLMQKLEAWDIALCSEGASDKERSAAYLAYRTYKSEQAAGNGPLVLDATTATVIFNTLQDYANVCSYRGERTGGVLKGCPRGPKPTADKLVRPAQFALKRLELCRRLPEDKE